eukprot:CAMPEP_0119322232 /NCGR_PEP_ID=MMETSP1333-20130426/57602_1 /TAXON_ID=418940 /ORGANISM="Scyphosphaera apsteinii, Strain RCC1455" /LENGTH=227 /DNA_ID=CAMNT_0007329403 /DNA_START=179 /DNA_END=863 /DNA_ORIENTATION=-
MAVTNELCCRPCWHDTAAPKIGRRAALSIAAVTVPLPAIAKDRVSGYPKQYIWEQTLSSGQYFVLRQGGTEPPNSSPLVKEKRQGTYICAACSTPLFDSAAKFESGTGWPSFATGLTGVEVVSSFTSALLGSELRCASCGGHLGDVFNDGYLFPGTPAALSGKRYCIDGAALTFLPIEGGEPASGDGLSKRRYDRPADVELPSWLQPPKVDSVPRRAWPKSAVQLNM